LQGNLVMNVIKEMAGKSGQDVEMIACFDITVQVDSGACTYP